MRHRPPTTVLAGLFVVACVGGGGEDSGGTDLCATQDMPTLEIGHAVDGEFAPYADGEVVQPVVAPQGGFGVGMVLATTGLQAHGDAYIDILLNIERAGVNEGSAFLPAMPVVCSGADIGGKLTGIVAAFDPIKYQSNEDLLALDGEELDLVITVTDGNGASVQARQPVTLQVGG